MKKHIIILLIIGIFVLFSGLKYKEYVLDYDYSKAKSVYTPEEKAKNFQYESEEIFIPDNSMQKLVKIRVKILKTENSNEKIRLIYNKILEKSKERYDIINKDVKIKNNDHEESEKSIKPFLYKVKLMDVFIQGDRIYVNFNSRLRDNISSEKDELLLIYSLVNSFTSIKELKKVKILINNKSVESLKFYNISGFFERDTSI